MKVLLIVLAVTVALGAVGVVGGIYAVHRLKRTVAAVARDHGVDLSDFAAAQSRGRIPDPCSLLTAPEASAILGVTIERTESHARRCEYFARPISDEERQARLKKSMEDLQARSKEHAPAADDGDTQKLARDSGVEEFTKTMVAGANTGSGPYFAIELSDNGRAQIAGMKLAMKAVAGGMRVTEALTGIGDAALMGPMDSMLVFTKGGMGVQIDLRQIPGARDRAIAMARQIVTRL